MKKISKILMNSGLFLSIFAVSGVTTYAICYANKDSQNLDNNKIEIPFDFNSTSNCTNRRFSSLPRKENGSSIIIRRGS